MRSWAKGSASAALLTAAVMAIGSGTAAADITDGDGSIGGGNQINIPVSLPIDISGNAVGVLGEAEAGSKGGASVENSGRRGTGDRTSGRNSVLGGNQVNAPIDLPVGACGNALSLVGSSSANCTGGASVKNHTTKRGGTTSNRTNGDNSVLGGNQVNAPITAPIDVCGNSLAIVGEATAGCRGGASITNNGAAATSNRTSGRNSVLGGNQVNAPITVPISVCGNAIAVLGEAFAGCQGGATVNNRGPAQGVKSKVKKGSKVKKVKRGKKAKQRRSTRPVSPVVGNRTDGDNSVLGGNQIIAPITAPIDVCGNAIAVLGEAFAGCKGGASVTTSGRGVGSNRTSGDGSVLGGNQITAPITTPISVCGNAAAVLADTAAGCLGGARVGKPRPTYGNAAPFHWTAVPHRGHMSGRDLATSGDLPVAQQALGLPELSALPDLPGLTGAPEAPAGSKTTGPLEVLRPAGDLVGATPAKNDVVALPMDGRMSAEQPIGVAGMHPGSLLALVLGAALATSTLLFAAVRRIRFRRG